MTWTPEFPDRDDAIEAHDAALEATGQGYAACINPAQVESALGRATNHWHYGEGSDDERMANAAAAIGHGVAQAQPFRTATSAQPIGSCTASYTTMGTVVR